MLGQPCAKISVRGNPLPLPQSEILVLIGKGKDRFWIARNMVNVSSPGVMRCCDFHDFFIAFRKIFQRQKKKSIML